MRPDTAARIWPTPDRRISSRKINQLHEIGRFLGSGDPGKIEAPDPATTPLHAVYAPGPYVAPKVRATIEFLTAHFGAETQWDGGLDMARGE